MRSPRINAWAAPWERIGTVKQFLLAPRSQQGFASEEIRSHTGHRAPSHMGCEATLRTGCWFRSLHQSQWLECICVSPRWSLGFCILQKESRFLTNTAHVLSRQTASAGDWGIHFKLLQPKRRYGHNGFQGQKNPTRLCCLHQ